MAATNPILSLPGLATGLDTQSIIDALSAVKQAPISRLNAKKTKLQKQQTEFSKLHTKVDALVSKVREFDTVQKLGAFATTTSDAAVVGATANGTAHEATYAVAIDHLAQGESRASAGFASKTTAVGSGTLGFTVNDVDYTVSLPAHATLEQIRDAINGGTAPVTATIVNDGTSTSPYKLVVSSKKTGAANTFVADFSNFTAEPSTSGLDLANELTAGIDAKFTINGLQVFSDSNTVTSAIDGVTLTLSKPASTATIGITRDNAKIKQNVNGIVSAFNDVIDELNSQQNVAQKDTTAVLYGDLTTTSLERSVRNVINHVVSTSSSTLRTLGAIGVKSDQNGHLSVDDTRFDAAIATDPDGLLHVITDAQQGIAAQVKNVAPDLSTAIFTPRSTSIRDRIRSIDNQVAALNDRLSKYVDGLRTKFATLESLVSKLQSQGATVGK